jgi:hypothetical protein
MKIILFLILLTPFFSYADWQYVKKISYGDVYLDNVNIKKTHNDVYKISILYDYGVRQDGIDRVIGDNLIYDTKFKPLSNIDIYLIHCKQLKSALLGSIYFSEKMTKGRKIFSDFEPEPMWLQDIDVEEEFPTIRKFVCN